MANDLPVDSPWLGLEAAAAYLPNKRSPRFIAREMKAGRIRHARIGGKREFVTQRAWLDDYIFEQAAPIAAPIRRRA
jgi:hypothetical protein